MKPSRLVVIGTSAGGMEALQVVFSTLPERLRAPIVVVQHLPADAMIQPSLVFGNSTKRKLVEIEDKMPVEDGIIYFAPPGYHTLIEEDGTFALSMDPPVNFSRPSIDVLFESAARAFGGAVTGVVMTGANHDGAAGLAAIKDAGGRAVVQDPATAMASSMPKEAVARAKPDAVVPLKEIASALLPGRKEDAFGENEDPDRR